MLIRWNDLGVADMERGFTAFHDLRREMDRLFEGFDRGWSLEPAGRRVARLAAPRMTLHDAGEALVLYADLPGFSEKNVEVTLEQESLTIRGRRADGAPEGYSVQHLERGDLAFTRSFSLPCPVDADAAQATLKHGRLELRLPKAKEAQPRRIAVKAG